MLEGVELAHVEVDEPDAGVLEGGLGRGREVRVARADADHEIGLAGHDVRPRRPRDPDGAEGGWIVEAQRTLAGLGLAHGDPRRGHEGAERVRRLGVEQAPPGHDQGAPAASQERGRAAHRVGIGKGPPYPPDPVLEEGLRVVPRLALHVLGQGEGDGARVGRAREHAHGLRKGGDELLGAADPVPVARHGLEDVVDREVRRRGRLQLLEDGGHPAGHEDVAREQEHGEPVDGGAGRPRHHVGGAGPDGAGAGEGREPIRHLGVARGRVDHRLLVAGRDVAQTLPRLLERLPHARHVAVAQDAEDAREEAPLDAVALGVLTGEELHQGLRHGQPPGLHGRSPSTEVKGTRGSRARPDQASRIQWWAGSSQKAMLRSGPGPARTFR